MKISLNFKIGEKQFSFNNNSSIIQFNLLDFNESMVSAWVHIKLIYYDILMDDDMWHFFYEGAFSIIRCQKKYKKKLEKYFASNNIDFKYEGEWTKDHRVVDKHRDCFVRMFHDFTILAITMSEGDFMEIADRITHSLFNHSTYMNKSFRSTHGEHVWEGIILSYIAALRSTHCGQIVESKVWLAKIKKAKEKKEKPEDNI